MPRSLIPLHRALALVLLAVVALVCVALGNWQLDRAAQRDAVHAAIETGRQQAPLLVTPATSAESFVDWRPARATGQWLDQYTVLLMNRNLNGVSGYWVATPLLLQPDGQTALLVLRGWIPRPIRPGETLPPLTAPEGIQTVEGQLVSRVPRMYELPTFGDETDKGALPDDAFEAGQPLPQVQNLPIEDLSRTTGLKLLPVVLEQTSSDAGGDDDLLIREWPLPSTDADQNRGYALQWFGFATIAAIAWLMVAWRSVRRRTDTRFPSSRHQ